MRGPRWDVLQLSQMPADSGSREKFRQFAAAAGRQTGVWESGAAPYLQLSSTWDAYLNGLSSKFKAEPAEPAGPSVADR